MKVKQAQRVSWYRRLGGIWSRSGRWRILLIVLALIGGQLLFALGSMYYAVQLHTSGQVSNYYEVVDQLVKAGASPMVSLRKLVRGRLARPEQLVVDIDFEDWHTLIEKHNEAYAADSLHAKGNPAVPAEIRVNGEPVKVDVRLKGGPRQFSGSKWSLRVRVLEPDKAILGLKTFSLQHPETRSYLNEWLLHRMMAREGVIALDYDFVEVIVNGRSQGVYALEEHFSKEVVERNERRVGPIIALTEELYNVNDWAKNWANEVRAVDAHQSLLVEQNELLRKQFLVARSLIERFRRGEMTTCEVFNCQMLARYFAVLDVLGASRAAESGNMKMHYNPVTSQLEPIVFGGESDYEQGAMFLRTWTDYKAADSADWIRQLFSDDAFMELYVQALSRMAEAEYLDDFFTDEAQELDHKTTILHADYPTYSYDPARVYARAERIRQVLGARKGIDAYVESADDSRITFSAATVLTVPVDVHGFKCSGETYSLDEPVRLRPMMPGALLAYQDVTHTFSASIDMADCMEKNLRVTYSLLGHDEMQKDAPSLLPRELSDFSQSDLVRQPGNHATFSFIEVDEEAKQIAVNPGAWTLDRNLIVPAGYQFVIGAETTLTLENAANILSHSPILFQGSTEAPVNIVSPNRDGGGIFVVSAGEESRLSWVVFDGLTAPKTDNWNLNGAVTFYESPVVISDATFSNNHDADEALSIVRSTFTMRSTSFVNVAFDGLDTDFATGEIVDSHVYGAGDDGFDLSGSTVEMERVSVSGAGDKGISLGERSKVFGDTIAISDSLVGVVSKDFSNAEIDDLELRDLNVGLALYQKSPVYGYGKMTVKDLLMENISEAFAVEKRSVLIVDEVLQPTASGNIADRF